MGHFFTTPRILRQTPPKGAIAAVILGSALLSAWCLGGSSIIAALNPELGRELAMAKHPPLDVWFTPPDFTGTPPTIISTPAGSRFEHDTLTLPQGSIISAHLDEQGGKVPELVIDGKSQKFGVDQHGDFAATDTLKEGRTLSIRRGWLTLASWKIRVIPDNPSVISLTEKPTLAEDRNLHVAYTVTDDFGVVDVALRITPHDPSLGANNAPIDIPLSMTSTSKEISRSDIEDLAAHPWAGQKITVQVVATNQAGKVSISDAAEITLPVRHFFHPIARVLIEERRKLMQNPDDEVLREETANIMASIAHETVNYHGDPLILMALRSGAVRLVLGHDRNAAISVNDLLWKTATRIEDGRKSETQHILRDAREDLS